MYKLVPGDYRMVFATGDYFARDKRTTLYPRVEVSAHAEAG